MDRRA
jgi:hypothetical protein